MRWLFGRSEPYEKRLARARQDVVNANSKLRDAESRVSWQRQPMPKYKAEQEAMVARVKAQKAQDRLQDLIDRQARQDG